MTNKSNLKLNPRLDDSLPKGYSLKRDRRRYCVVTSLGFPLSMTSSTSKREAIRNYHQLFGGIPVYIAETRLDA